MRKGNWKLVCKYPGDWELYDIVANLAACRFPVIGVRHTQQEGDSRGTFECIAFAYPLVITQHFPMV